MRYSTAERGRYVLGSVGPGHQAAHPGPCHLRRDAGRLPAAGRGHAVRRHRRGADRDVPGPAADQGGHARGQAGPGVRGARSAGHRPRHRGDHRHHAARDRDRGRADRAGAAGYRPDRAELRHRPRRDERAPAAPVPLRPDRGELHAERGPAPADLRRRALPAEAGRTGRRAGAVRRGVRARTGRRVLRHRAGAPAPGRGAAGGSPARAAYARTHGRGRLAVRGGAVPPGHQLSLDRRADQRQRLQGLPRGAAGGALGGLRRYRPVPDPRRRAPAGPEHRLRRPRRPGRHARDGLPAGHGVHAADRAGLHRAGGAAGRAGMPGRAGGDQLGQLRGRGRSRLAVHQDHEAGRRARFRGHRADHRRGGPGAYGGVEGRGRRPADHRPHRSTGACRPATSSSTA